MIELKNTDVELLIQSESLKKLVNTLNGEKAYDLSLIVKKLKEQYDFIIENRDRISLKFFPLVDGKQEGIVTNLLEVSEEEGKVFIEKRNKFSQEVQIIYDKDFILEEEKIFISREKIDGKSELGSLNLTTLDLLNLEKIIDIK